MFSLYTETPSIINQKDKVLNPHSWGFLFKWEPYTPPIIPIKQNHLFEYPPVCEKANLNFPHSLKYSINFFESHFFNGHAISIDISQIVYAIGLN